MIFTALIAVIGAYLLGSVNFAVVFTKAFKKKDVRAFGSGNPGSTNALRVGGKRAGIFTFLCDTLKGVAACLLGKFIFMYIASVSPSVWANPVYGEYICGIACLLGHVFPIFFKFKGGKGVATGVGAFFVCCPIAAVIGIAVFGISFLLSKTVSISSLIASFSVVLFSVVFYNKEANIWIQLILGFIMLCIVFIRHKANIERLVNGEENTFSNEKEK